MATIPQTVGPKYKPPEGMPPEWLIESIYSDVKEIKEDWCPRIRFLQWAVGALTGGFGITFLILFMLHPQDMADGLASFFGVK